MLDIVLLRTNPDVVRRSQQSRCADLGQVDLVLALDAEWRRLQGKADKQRTNVSACSRMIGEKKKAKEADGEELPIPDSLLQLVSTAEVFDPRELAQLNVAQLKRLSKEVDQEVQRTMTELDQKEIERDQALGKIGNIVHEACRPTANEEENDVVRKWGEPKPKTETTLNHVDLCARLGMETGELATKTAGGRAYFLTGPLVQLQLALVNYAMNFLIARGSTPIYPPYFMTKEAMGAVAQLADFDEMLYKVTGEGEDKYLIATSEQPICAFHRNRWFSDKELPLKYAGFSTCFRKEAGSHGRDTLGIFRVHQFEKIEQFAVTTCKENKSWEMLEDMITNSEAFYQSLGIHYRVVRIVAGALNDAAAMKYDLEGWYPASQTYRELVSCSNCTDFQSRRLNARMGSGKAGGQAKEKEYVHMLNATLCAVTRVMCVICETYQTPEGIEVPEVLRPYMGGLALLKYLK